MKRICKDCGRTFLVGENYSNAYKNCCYECGHDRKKTAALNWHRKQKEAHSQSKKYKSNSEAIEDIANIAFKEGLSYGEYVSKHNL